MIAYCYASGEICFTPQNGIPQGAIWIAKGGQQKVRNLIHGTAKLAYDGATWLVPGVPEAANQKDKADALNAYLNWIKTRKVKGLEINAK